jgi:hypothetical protein
MHSHSTMPIVRQGGQIVPVALFGILIASTVLAIMFDTSQKVTEKSRVANAADAAAYSAAVWTARHLNFIAYINRAMIANHAAVGHLVSYVSWIRYVDDSIDSLDNVTQWIPYVGQYVDVVQRIAGEIREATEREASVAVPAIDHWNAVLRAAQLETQVSLAADGLQDLMARTASAYDPAIHINDASALEQLPDELREVLEAQLIEQSAAVPGFIHRYSAGNDRNSVSQLIDASLRTNADLQHWLTGNRGWREDLLAVQIRKRGNSTPTQGSSSADWQATDDLQFRRRDFLGWQRWMRIGDKPSTASAREFASNYAGVPNYFNVTGDPADRSLPIMAIATRSSDVAASARLKATIEDYPIVVAALARVEFRRSSNSAFAPLADNRQEYSNLFNPFWEAHLAPLESASLTSTKGVR